jgi:hypothetical protein
MRRRRRRRRRRKNCVSEEWQNDEIGEHGRKERQRGREHGYTF